MQRMASGPQTSIGRIGLTKFYLGMRICLKSWMASSFQWWSTVNISRSTSRASGMVNSKANATHQVVNQPTGPNKRKLTLCGRI
jgi:hypothetical protein